MKERGETVKVPTQKSHSAHWGMLSPGWVVLGVLGVLVVLGVARVAGGTRGC